MYHITERNERRNRTIALWMAVSLHLALGAALYFTSNTTPDNSITSGKSTPAAKYPAANTP